MPISEELRAEVQSIMDDNAMPILSGLQKIMQLCVKHKVGWYAKHHPSEVACHESNRGRLGINPHNAHRNGARMHKIGCDPKLLEASACMFEMSRDPETKARQIAFNERLIAISGGLLAPLTGAERFISVGTGHTVAFCRAAIHGCKTLLTQIADADGTINKRKLETDPGFNVILNEGWMFYVFDADVEVCLPKLPDYAQRALNAVHSVPSESSELEIMASIAEFQEMSSTEGGGGGGGVSWSACVTAACAGNPPCASYADALGKFDELFGGGKGCPVVKELDNFAKEHCENVRMGEEFTRAVVDSVYSPVLSYPRIRQACFAAQLTAPKAKVYDGVARFLTKTDIANFGRHRDLDECENTMEAAHAFVGGTQNPAYWMLLVRCVAFMAGKGKTTMEARVFQNLAEIKSAFVVEFAARARVEASTLNHPWLGNHVAAADGVPSSSKALDVYEMDLPENILKRHGYVGSCYERSSPATVFTIQKVQNASVYLKEHKLHGDGLNATVPFKTFLAKWAPYRSTLQVSLPDDTHRDFSCAPASDLAIASYYLGLCEYNTKVALPTQTKIGYHMKPAEVIVLTNIEKGALILAPMVKLSGITTKKAGKPLEVAFGKVDLYVNKPVQPTNNPSEWKAEVDLLSPYHWVKVATSPTQANCVQKIVKHGQCKIPIITNNRAIQEFEQLAIYQKPSAAVRLAGAKLVTETEMDGEAKRRRSAKAA
jgi:hypothetical protein